MDSMDGQQHFLQPFQGTWQCCTLEISLPWFPQPTLSSSSSSLSAPLWFWLLFLCLSPQCPCFLWFHLILLLPYSTLSLKSPHTQLQLTATYFQLVWKYLPILHLCSPDLSTSWLHFPAAISLEASQVAQLVKNLPANARDSSNSGLIPRLGRSPGGGNGNPLQYSCLENSMDWEGWQARVHRATELDMTEHACMHISLWIP